MDIQDINEPLSYHYSRSIRGQVQSGTGAVVQKYRGANGWHVIVHDRKNKRAVTLRPAHILRRVRVR